MEEFFVIDLILWEFFKRFDEFNSKCISTMLLFLSVIVTFWEETLLLLQKEVLYSKYILRE